MKDKDKSKEKNKLIQLIAFILVAVVILVILFRKNIISLLSKIPDRNSAINDFSKTLEESNSQFQKSMMGLVENIQNKLDNSTKQVINQNGSTIVLKGIGWKRTIAQEEITRGYVVRVHENDGIDRSYRYDPHNIENYGLATGIALHSATAGQECFIQVEGTAEIPNWGLPSNTLMFIGPMGVLTPTAPNQGLSQTAGNSISPDEININFSQPIILNND
ncbi:hypothetical protein [Flectobacillus sp. BAB-3569]|uniref:hypothetical protein n=1 Tax=Flectobacillus sp. BAB-3569 TaxID=1509483 RepID=UPI000BA3463C|nr:hypothetical protein [Flectobacillus sp. BAB-3569]PAC27018.1 hypothetical protein BWI92_24165 [Flectobacillus sp. BAB-3569]